LANPNLPLGTRGIFIPGTAADWIFPDGTWTLTRGAAGNYFMRKTAGAATTHPAVNIQKAIRRAVAATAALASVNSPLGGELQEGGLFTGFDLVYAIGTAALTSLAVATYNTVYVNNTAPAVTSPGGAVISYPTSTVALPIATQAQPYLVTLANTTPYLIGLNLGAASDWIELTVVDPGTAVFDIYGVLVKMNANR
jgi:hypothetical protein